MVTLGQPGHGPPGPRTRGDGADRRGRTDTRATSVRPWNGGRPGRRQQGEPPAPPSKAGSTSVWTSRMVPGSDRYRMKPARVAPSQSSLLLLGVVDDTNVHLPPSPQAPLDNDDAPSAPPLRAGLVPVATRSLLEHSTPGRPRGLARSRPAGSRLATPAGHRRMRTPAGATTRLGGSPSQCPSGSRGVEIGRRDGVCGGRW